MAVNFSSLILAPNYDLWARAITVIPIASQPGAPAYVARGIYSTRMLDVMGEDGSILSTQQTILDIMESEFMVQPMQRDVITIGIDLDAGLPALGDFEVVDHSSDGGGETTLVIRKVEAAAP